MGVFTRDESELLSYDGVAFYYFALTLLAFVVIPWTWVLANWLWRPRPPEDYDFDARGPAPDGTRLRRCATAAMEAKRQNAIELSRLWIMRLRGTVWLQMLALTFLWVCLGHVLWSIRDLPTELQTFNPYQILEIQHGASLQQIKKAYRVKSLQHHPDKDTNNPLAPVLFHQVSKAYAALTDESARRNYEKYGNPDGPTQMKVGVALHPALLVSEESQRLTLITFFFGLFLVPTLVMCFGLGPGVSASFVSQKTIQIYQVCIDTEVRAKDGPALLAASVEARRIRKFPIEKLVSALAKEYPQPLKPGIFVVVGSDGTGPAEALRGRRGFVHDCKEGSPICQVNFPGIGVKELPCMSLTPEEPGYTCMFRELTIRHTAMLLWAHLWRMHAHIDAKNKQGLNRVLRASVMVGRAMASIAAHGPGDRSDYFEVVRDMVVFRRALVQALDIGANPLLQLPHVSRVPEGVSTTLREVVEGKAEGFFEKMQFTPEQRLDIDEFVRHAPRVELACTVEVDDEETIAEGDLAVLKVTLTRLNLEEGEAVGCVHAPYFPGAKFEEWWLIVYDDRSRRLVTADVVLSTGRVETAKIRFMVPRKGPFKWTVHAMCDSYEGLDVTQSCEFVALGKNEVSREIFVHPADMKIRTLFEDIMLGLQPDENDDSDSDSETEEEKARKREGGQKAAAATTPGGDAGSDDEDGMLENEREGVFYRVTSSSGALVYREPCEDPKLRFGSLPAGTVVRGFVDDEKLSGWLELAPNGGIFLKIDPPGEENQSSGDRAVEYMGELCEQRLCTVVQTPLPIRLVRTWMTTTTCDIDAEDLVQAIKIEDRRARMIVEELVRKRTGDDQFVDLQDACDAIRQRKKQRLSKVTGLFMSQNQIVWHVTATGAVHGLHLDGSRIRDRIQVTQDDELRIGPFVLDETRTCVSLHWVHKGESSKNWVWQQAPYLEMRMKVGLSR